MSNKKINDSHMPKLFYLENSREKRKTAVHRKIIERSVTNKDFKGKNLGNPMSVSDLRSGQQS